jgi:hypothetical protein
MVQACTPVKREVAMGKVYEGPVTGYHITRFRKVDYSQGHLIFGRIQYGHIESWFQTHRRIT